MFSSLRAKFLLVFGSLVLLSVVQGSIGLMLMAQIQEQNSKLTTLWFPLSQNLNRFEVAASAYRMNQMEHILLKDLPHKAVAESKVQREDAAIRETLADIDNLDKDEKVASLTAAVATSWSSYREIGKSIIAASKALDNDGAYNLLSSQGSRQFDALVANLVSLRAYAEKQTTDARLAGEQVQVIASFTIVGVSLGSAVIGLIMAIVAAGRLVGKPVRRLLEAFAVMGEGDLTVHFPGAGKDEMGKLMTGAGDFADRLRVRLGRVVEACAQAAGIAEELRASMENANAAMTDNEERLSSLAGGLGDGQQLVQEAAKTVLAIGDGIQELAELIRSQASELNNSSASIEQMLANVNAVAKNTEGLQGVVSELVKSFDTARAELAESTEQTRKVSEQSRNLGEINSVIQTISAQTNLLAMNAAIEAAHAGDHGRGFAVVADEIRKLAESAGIQARKSSDNLKTIALSINRMVEASGKVESSFDGNMALASRLQELTGQTSAAMEEQSQAGRHVMEGISRLNTVTKTIEVGSRNMEEGTVRAGEAMSKVSKSSKDALASVEQVTLNSQRILGEVFRADKLSDQTLEAVSRIKAETDKYKLN